MCYTSNQFHEPRAFGVISCARVSTVTLPRPLFDIISGEEKMSMMHIAYNLFASQHVVSRSQTLASLQESGYARLVKMVPPLSWRSSPLQCSFNCVLHPHSLSLVRSRSFNLEMHKVVNYDINGVLGEA